MEQMENQQEIINAAVAHVITWMAIRMMTTALSLAFDAGLFDLKEYMSPEDLSEIYEGHPTGCLDVERDLLEIVEDPDVKTVVASMEQLFEFADSYLMINSIDELEEEIDDAGTDLANKIYEVEPFNETLKFEQQKTRECDNYVSGVALKCYQQDA
jgi:aromatic ring hydroxylase